MNYNTFNFLLLSIVFYMSIAQAEDVIPFESCSKKRTEWTNKIAKEAFEFNLFHSSDQTEAASLCTDCIEHMNRLRDFNVFNIGSSILPICFYASALIAADTPRPRLYGCRDKNSEWPDGTNRVRPCLNESYVYMTAKAFNGVANCFEFSLEEKKAIFALFNHESHFILNARSPEKARCYGQMTMDTIKYVNQNIYFRNHGYKFGDVYRNAIRNCPGLRDKVIPPNLVTETRFNNTRLRRKMKRASITCGLTQDPYACLFYSMFNVKINLKEFNDNYNDIPNYRGSQEISGAVEEDFQLPIMLNEVLMVKGTMTNKATGKTETIDRVFWDSSQVADFLADKKYRTSNLEIKKVSVFEKKTLRNAFLHYAHNGGRSIVADHLPVFVEGIKRRVAASPAERGDSCGDNKTCSQYRSLLKKGQSLGISDLQTEFISYARRNRLTNVGELVNFSQKVAQGLGYVHNADNEIVKHLNMMDIDPPANTKGFIDQVKESCPESVY